MFGVALGVAALVAIDVVNNSSQATIDELVGAYAGRATLTVRAASGTLPADALETIRGLADVEAAAGSIQGSLLVGPEFRDALPFIAGTGDEHALRDYRLARGRGPVGEEALLGAAAARRLEVDDSDSFRALTPSGAHDIEVAGILHETGLGRANAGLVATIPFETADEWYLRNGRADAIDIIATPGADLDALSARIAGAVPGAQAQTPSERGGQTKKLVASLQSLLQVVSALSLFIGTFLVFNTMSVAVAQRRRDFGILRALGTRRRDLVALVCAEAALLGALAATLGAAAGIVMARALLSIVNEQIRASFVAGLADQLVLSAPRLLGLVMLGVAAGMFGALWPALTAANTPPSQAMSAPRHPASVGPLRLRLLAFAVVCAGLSVAALAVQRGADDPTPASVSAFALMLAIALAAAPLLTLAVRALGPILDRALGLPARLARDSVLRNPGRAAVTAAALSAAITMVVGMASFIQSDRQTIFEWVDQAVNADYFVSAAPLGANSTPISLDPALADGIARIPGVRAVDRFRQIRVSYRDSFAALASTDISVYVERSTPLFAPGSRPHDLASMADRDEVAVSDNFTKQHGIGQGDVLRLDTPDGPHDFLVVAQLIDYTTDQGLIFMDRASYARHFHDTTVDSFAVIVTDRESGPAVRDALEQVAGGTLFVQSNGEFKDSIRKLVNDFFSTTYVMEAIALLVGILGITNTTIVAVLERRREMGVLRAVGASRRQIRSTVLIEAAMIGTLGALLGAAGGAALAGMTLVVSESTTGWVLPYVYEWRTAISVSALAILAALLAAYLPARDAARHEIAAALAYE